MDNWGFGFDKGFFGHPANLMDNKIYTLDHRRLVAYIEAGRESVPVNWLGFSERNLIYSDRFKFSTKSYGTVIYPWPIP